MSGPTDLQASIAARILSHGRQLGWPVGHHVTEGSLEAVLGTSRSPIRAALALLEADGVLERRPNRGYFVRHLPRADPDGRTTSPETGDGERVYLAIAMDRLARRLPEVVSENELMRRYALTRAQLRIVLTRIATEGWVARRPGRGWLFPALIDTVDAYRENYRFRQMVEPASLLAPEFRPDTAVIGRLRSQQQAIRDDGYRTLGQVELYAINADFHESLAAMGHNRFVCQALARVNHARRLMEYARPLDRLRVRRVCEEHLGILDAIAAGNRNEAARRLAAHLSEAADEKTAMDHSTAGKEPT
jgi:DNA-binding GntR family transcriptional regulator